MTRASIQNRVVGGSVLAVAVTLGVTGIAVHRATEVRLQRSGREVLRSVLELGADRVAAEAVLASRRGEHELDAFDETLEDGYLWICRRAPQSEELARSSAFPTVAVETGDLSDVALEPGGRSVIEIRETNDEEGAAFRVARVVIEPVDRTRMGMRRQGRRAGPPSLDSDRGRGERVRRQQGGPPQPGSTEPGPPQNGGGPQRGQDPPPFRPGEQFVVVVALPIQQEVESHAQLARLLAMAGLGAMVVAALSIRVVVRRGLAPLDDLSMRVASIGATDLDDAIEVAGAPTELEPIIASFDATRARLADAFTREKRFTSDAAHELRTPIAGIRATLEVVLRRERTNQEHREAATQCLEIALSMQDTVESLLLLARSGVDANDREPVDLQSAMRRSFAPYAEALEHRGVTVRYGFEGREAVASVVPALLERVASNLASNAASYASSGSTIDVGASVQEGRIALTVSNPCDPLPSDAAERAFEPFWRADTARTDQGTHAGLGLALVRSCLDAMDGDVSIDAADHRFAITVRLPGC